jgi:Histidine kinase-, DNA gyrase B-, and HSP90-like ATPase
VNIRPGVSVLGVLKHLNYQPWFACAEFVDNSLQSFLHNREAIQRVEGASVKLKVSIDIDSADGGKITIRDNAAGIGEIDYRRAFKPADAPADRSGLSEFGMGMKSAACYFAAKWLVRTSALGEPVEKTVAFDIETIVRNELEELDVDLDEASPTTHFTEVVLTELHKLIQGKTIWKIKEHLADIYRVFERQGVIELSLNGELLTYQEPPILVAPHFRNPDGEPRTWRADIDLDFGEGLSATGFAAIREVGSTSRAGFALFRRGRLIQGSGDQGYRPEFIFGQSNSFPYQRICGELHLEGFQVSHTKDGFRWEEHEEIFLEFLKEKLEEESMPILQQARYYRSRPRREDYRRGGQTAVERTSDAIQREAPPVVESLVVQPPSQTLPETLPEASTPTSRVIELSIHDVQWRVTVALTDDPAVGDWLEVSDRPPAMTPGVLLEEPRCLGLRMSLVHPFMQQFGGTDASQIEPLLRIAAAIGPAETIARDSGVRMAGAIRNNINELLKSALARP